MKEQGGHWIRYGIFFNFCPFQLNMNTFLQTWHHYIRNFKKHWMRRLSNYQKWAFLPHEEFDFIKHRIWRQEIKNNDKNTFTITKEVLTNLITGNYTLIKNWVSRKTLVFRAYDYDSTKENKMTSCSKSMFQSFHLFPNEFF